MTSLCPTLLSTLALLLFLGPTALRADVIVVDADGGGDFTVLQDAINAAVDGDTVLIRSGNYLNTPLAGIGGKSLVIVGDVGVPPTVPPLNVFNLPAGGSVVLRHLILVPNEIVGFIGGTLAVNNCDGAVYIEDVGLPGLPGRNGLQGLSATDAFPGLSVFNSSSVSLQRCNVSGGRGTDTDASAFPTGQMVTSRGGDAARVRSSRIAFSDCVIAGGRGGNDDDGLATAGGDGGHGIAAESSQVNVSGCVVVGGNGGNGCSAIQVNDGCRGANGFQQVNVGSALQELDSTFTAGVGGALDGGGTGFDGVPRDLGTGFHLPFTGSSVGLTIHGPLRTGETGTITVTGPEGSLFGLFFGFGPGYLPLLHFKGVFLPALPIDGPVLLEVMPPGGEFSVDYVAPDIASFGLESLITVDQVLMDQSADGVILSASSTHVQVDTGF